MQYETLQSPATSQKHLTAKEIADGGRGVACKKVYGIKMLESIVDQLSPRLPALNAKKPSLWRRFNKLIFS